MKDFGKPRTMSALIAKSVGCTPLREALAQAIQKRPRTWAEVEQTFVNAMEGFDKNLVEGVADIGDLQNGKGDFFNDLLTLLLENCAEVELYSRPSVPGLVFPKHKLDVSYPKAGPVRFVLEAKAVGTPRHPWSPKEKAIGRPGSADLDKRVKEVGFKTIDLKAEYARVMAARGERPTAISGDLTTWLHSVRPRSYLFIAARVVSTKDKERVIRFADLAGMVSDAVGVFCFRPTSEGTPTRYQVEALPPHIELSRVLFRACQDLTALRGSGAGEPTSHGAS